MISQRVQFGWLARRLGLKPSLFGGAEGRIQGMSASLRGLGTLELVLGGLPQAVAFRPRGRLFRPPGFSLEIGDPDFDQCFLVAGDERQARALLDSNARRRLLKLSPRIELRLQNGRLRGRLPKARVASRTRPDALIWFQEMLTLAHALQLEDRVMDHRLVDLAVDDPCAQVRSRCLRVLVLTGELRPVEMAARTVLVGMGTQLRTMEVTGTAAGQQEALVALAMSGETPLAVRAATVHRLASLHQENILLPPGRASAVVLSGLSVPYAELQIAASLLALQYMMGEAPVEDALIAAVLATLTALSEARRLSPAERARAQQVAAVVRASLGTDKAGALSLAQYEGGGLSLVGEGGRLSLASKFNDRDGSEV